jgi:hypothetical protein
MKRTIIVTLLLLGPSACMTYDEARVGTQGSSIYDIHYQQIADKALAANPGTDISPSGADGPLIEKAMDSYRGVGGDATQVAQPIQINIGN